MRYLILMLLLSGCSIFVPTRPSWPEVPNEISEVCPQLEKLAPDTSKLSDVVSSVSNNYSTYYECQAKHEAWVEWYKNQRQIYENVK